MLEEAGREMMAEIAAEIERNTVYFSMDRLNLGEVIGTYRSYDEQGRQVVSVVRERTLRSVTVSLVGHADYVRIIAEFSDSFHVEFSCRGFPLDDTLNAATSEEEKRRVVFHFVEEKLIERGYIFTPRYTDRESLGRIERVEWFREDQDRSYRLRVTFSNNYRCVLVYSDEEVATRRDWPRFPASLDNMDTIRFIEDELRSRGLHFTSRLGSTTRERTPLWQEISAPPSVPRINYEWNSPSSNPIEDLNRMAEYMATRVGFERRSPAMEQSLRRLAEEKEAAQARAMATLNEFLDDRQRKDLEEVRCFIVEGEKTGRQYVITKGTALNVASVVDGKLIRYCVAPSGNLPAGDVMLTQLLLLQTDEQRFLDKANIHTSSPLMTMEHDSQGRFVRRVNGWGESLLRPSAGISPSIGASPSISPSASVSRGD